LRKVTKAAGKGEQQNIAKSIAGSVVVERKRIQQKQQQQQQ
jgi:hypothetical protein